jgi:hypothetical protein
MPYFQMALVIAHLSERRYGSRVVNTRATEEAMLLVYKELSETLAEDTPMQENRIRQFPFTKCG